MIRHLVQTVNSAYRCRQHFKGEILFGICATQQGLNAYKLKQSEVLGSARTRPLIGWATINRFLAFLLRFTRTVFSSSLEFVIKIKFSSRLVLYIFDKLTQIHHAICHIIPHSQKMYALVEHLVVQISYKSDRFCGWLVGKKSAYNGEITFLFFFLIFLRT